jgi:uncharacterized membrane protein
MILNIILPFVSIYFVNNNNEPIYLYVYLLYVIIEYIVISFKQCRQIEHVIIIYTLSFGLFMLLPLRSEFVFGRDVNYEFNTYLRVINSNNWNIEKHLLGVSLYTSLVPAIFTIITGFNKYIIYKFFYVLIFMNAPIIVYMFVSKFTNKEYAFIASFFLTSQLNSLYTSYHCRTNTAILFSFFLFNIIMNHDMSNKKNIIISSILFTSMILSHYSTSYIVLYILYCVFIMDVILNKKMDNNVLIMLIIYTSILYISYSQVGERQFRSGVEFMFNTIKHSFDYFITTDKGLTDVILGKDILLKSNSSKIYFTIIWIIFVNIFIGFITVFYNTFTKIEDYIKYSKLVKLSYGYLIISLLSIMIPHISKGYSLTRIFMAASMIFSLLFIIGVDTTLNKIINRPYRKIIMLTIIIILFITNTGLTYNLEGHKKALFDNNSEEYAKINIYNEDFHTSQFIVQHTLKSIKSDYQGRMTIYGTSDVEWNRVTYFYEEISEITFFRSFSINNRVFEDRQNHLNSFNLNKYYTNNVIFSTQMTYVYNNLDK